MIGEKKATQIFCVKYSDFCKCKKCEFQRNRIDNIGPENQKLLEKNRHIKEQMDSQNL